MKKKNIENVQSFQRWIEGETRRVVISKNNESLVCVNVVLLVIRVVETRTLPLFVFAQFHTLTYATYLHER